MQPRIWHACDTVQMRTNEITKTNIKVVEIVVLSVVVRNH